MPGKVDESGWVMVRLPRDLHTRLRAMRMLWQDDYEHGRGRMGSPDDEPLALHAIIAELYRRDQEHRRRARRSSRKQRPTWAENPREAEDDRE